MKYETVKTLNDADFKRSTGVSRRVFAQMLQVIEKGLRSFGRPPKLSRADQLLLTLMYRRLQRRCLDLDRGIVLDRARHLAMIKIDFPRRAVRPNPHPVDKRIAQLVGRIWA